MSAAIQTWSGRLFSPLEPDPDAVDIADIAHALAHQCRFGGHSRAFFSIAQHCCVVADELERRGAPPEDVLWALLHDAGEAYLGDLPHPIKHRSPLGALYREIEAPLQELILARFGLSAEAPALVKTVDRATLAAERRALMVPTADAAWPELDGVEPLDVELDPWPPERAATEFLARYERLEAAR